MDKMDEALKDKLIELFGELVVNVGAELLPVYGGAIARLTWQEVLALDDYLRRDEIAEAKALVRSKMTPEELTVEKERLVGLTFEMAENQAEGWSITKSLLKAGFQVVLAATIGLVGL